MKKMPEISIWTDLRSRRVGISCLDVAKRAGQVKVGLGQSGLRVKRVAGQNRSFLNGLIVLGQVDPYFSNKVFFFFFFQLQNKSMTTYLERMNKIN